MNYREQVLYACAKYRAAGLSFVPVVFKGKRLDYEALRDTRMVNAVGIPTLSHCLKKIATEEEADHWFAGQDRNIGIVTGYDHVIAVDFDNARDFDAWKERYGEVCRQTPIQKTQSGYHILLKSRRRYRGFRRAFLGDRQVGHVLGFKRWLSVWPSMNGASDMSYVWLGGNAPWEVGMVTIDSLEDVGIRVTSTLAVRLRRLWYHVQHHNVIAKLKERLGY